MKPASPVDLDQKVVQSILTEIQSINTMSARMKEISRKFIGYRYIANPLIGAPGSPEIFTVSLAGFDCVTYVETVLALAQAESLDQFVESLRRIRYEHGQVDWTRRNHYMSGWIRNNVRQGFLSDLTRGNKIRVRGRTLAVLDGLPAVAVKLECFPKIEFSRLRDRIADGDLIFFVSTRQNLDIFHCGVLVRGSDPSLRILLRHAARSRNKVVEQDLEEFFRENRMSGFILVRPVRRRH